MLYLSSLTRKKVYRSGLVSALAGDGCLGEPMLKDFKVHFHFEQARRDSTADSGWWATSRKGQRPVSFENK
jgi:hypothetical protein